MNERVYIRHWLELKPYKVQTTVDNYYLNICNGVKKTFRNKRHASALQRYLHIDEIDLLSCFLTSYFEDLISETNIWNSFVRVHKRLYGKQLPFYNLDNYYEEEINPQDISFLIWYFINTAQNKKFVSPFNDFIVEIAVNVFDVFDKEWEFAPENEYLKTFYQINPKENNYYIARNLIDTVLFGTYLFYPDTYVDLLLDEFEIVEDAEDERLIEMQLNETRDVTLHNVHTKLLALKGKEWATEILGQNHLLSKDLLAISNRIQGFFLYKGQDKDNVFIEHIASGKKFNLTKKSFDHSHELKNLDTIMYLGIVMWQKEWWFSGVYFNLEFNPDIIQQEKNSVESKMTVDFLDYNKQETDEIIEQQFAAFKEFNNGSQIAFLPSDKIDEFYQKYIEFYNGTFLNISKEKIKKAKQKLKNEGYLDTESESDNYSEISETGLAFYNPVGGSEIALDINSAFPLPSNPYFKEEESELHVKRLLMADSLSTELAMFCIDNCKDKLSFFKNEEGKKYLEDIDFLLRFWKKDNYHTKIRMTFVGGNEKTE
ncbi:MAG TPA: DUF3843 family protein [Bacteroidales bacterium]|nr:DUF3843 family protein [Bacteroidales bacterium]HOR60582.1 DUF3843 family protein [Bacteroidales bacterium]HPL03864.1 DUF3843 family protein [Bacteroidales bacterium]